MLKFISHSEDETIELACKIASKLNISRNELISQCLDFAVKNIEFKKDSTLEFTKLVKDTLQKNNKILQKRLYMAFPSIDFSKLIEIKNNVKKDLKEIKDDIKTTIKEKLNNIDN